MLLHSLPGNHSDDREGLSTGEAHAPTFGKTEVRQQFQDKGSDMGAHALNHCMHTWG